MLAPEATNRSGHLNDRVFEAKRQSHVFSGFRVENRAHCAAERRVLSPQFHLQRSPATIKENAAFDSWPRTILALAERVASNKEIVGSRNPHHFKANHHRCDRDGVDAVHCNAVHSLKPR